LKVTADGRGVVSHAGARLVADMAERAGLGTDLSEALAPIVRRRRRHDPGEVLVDLAVTLADGGECVSDLQVLRDQPSLFGDVASQPTAWRVLDAVDAELLGCLQQARAASRARVWSAGLAPKTFTLDFDSSLVDLHSEKELAAPTYKRGYGYHPIFVYLDETHEALAAKLRTGSAGANTAADHIELLEAAIAQLPVSTRADDSESGVDVLVRADSAGATHGFVNAIVRKGFELSIGFDITEAVRLAILEVPEKAWQTPISQQMEDREGAGVAEITSYLDLSSWGEGIRAIVRREEPHVGAQFNLFDPAGWRHQCFITNSTTDDIVYLEARHRGHARVEDRIKAAKDLGLLRFPGHDFAANAAWLLVVGIAQDLTAWTQALCLEAELAHAEAKRLRYCVWHAAGRLVRTGRRLILRIEARWPWAQVIAAAFDRLHSLSFRT
jgi:Transposase DDE domain group 1